MSRGHSFLSVRSLRRTLLGAETTRLNRNTREHHTSILLIRLLKARARLISLGRILIGSRDLFFLSFSRQYQEEQHKFAHNSATRWWWYSAVVQHIFRMSPIASCEALILLDSRLIPPPARVSRGTEPLVSQDGEDLASNPSAADGVDRYLFVVLIYCSDAVALCPGCVDQYAANLPIDLRRRKERGCRSSNAIPSLRWRVRTSPAISQFPGFMCFYLPRSTSLPPSMANKWLHSLYIFRHRR